VAKISGQQKQMDFEQMLSLNAERLEALRARILTGSVDAAGAGRLISRSRSTVLRLARTNGLLAVRDGRRIQYPRWQFDATSGNGVVTGLDIVLAAMDASSFRKAAWLIKPNRHLDDLAPIEALRIGLLHRVYAEAKTVASS
jgi:hypothetical protein